MSLTLLITIFISIGVLAVVSITIGILNWISLSSSSSTLNKLQNDIEKKYQEADAQRKGTSVQTEYKRHESKVITPEHFNEMKQRGSEQPVKNQNIEIVRNVRGGFASPETTHLTHESIAIHKASTEMNPQPAVQPKPPLQQSPVMPQKPPAVPPSQPPQQPPATHPEPVNPGIPPQQPKPSQPAFPQQAPQQPNQPKVFINKNLIQPESAEKKEPEAGIPRDKDNVMEIVDETPGETRRDEGTGPISLPLYSQASQDADFTALWESLKKVLEATPEPKIAIDFKNVLFLYENEIEYLRKISKTITLRKGSLSFIFCSPELSAILANDEELKNHIKE